MSLKIIYKKITKQTSKVDAIINFVDNKNMNIITKEILSNLSKEELNTEFERLLMGNNECIIENESKSLKTKVIYNAHIPSNYSKDQLKDYFYNLIFNVYHQGYHSMMIPIIELLSSGYYYDDMYDALQEVCCEFDNDRSGTPKIILCNYVDSITKIKDEYKTIDEEVKRTAELNRIKLTPPKIIDKSQSIDFNQPMHHYLTTTSFKKAKSKMDDNPIYLNALAMGQMEEKDFIDFDAVRYSFPYDFVARYGAEKHINVEKILRGHTYKQRISEIQSQDSLKKETLFSIGYILDFTNTEMLELLICNGYSYNPGNVVDEYFKNYFSRKNRHLKFDTYGKVVEYFYFNHHFTLKI